MEYYSAIKKNKIMPFAATWMQLEMIILREEKGRDGEGRGGEEGEVSLSTVFSIWALTGRINPVSSLNLISYIWFHELPKLLD